MFAQESEILSEVPAELGLCQADSSAQEGCPAAFFHSKLVGVGLGRGTKTFWGTEEAGCHEGIGGHCPLCETSRVESPHSSQAATSQSQGLLTPVPGLCGWHKGQLENTAAHFIPCCLPSPFRLIHLTRLNGKISPNLFDLLKNQNPVNYTKISESRKLYIGDNDRY